MVKRNSATDPRSVPSRRRDPAESIDVVRHRYGLVDASATVRELVARLEQGKIILTGMSADNENRDEAERLWMDIVLRLHQALRDCYARFALLRIAIGNDAALALWDDLLPTADALADIGIPDQIAYWKGRTDRPEWLTHQEAQFVTKSLWPPNGTDPIDRGLLDLISEPPF